MSMLYLRQPHFYQWRELCDDSESEFIAHKSSDMMLKRFTERVELLDSVFGFRAQFAVYSDVEGPYTAEEALCSHLWMMGK